MDRVLIVGASGFLGKELYKNFRKDKNYATYGTYSKNNRDRFEYLDISHLESVTDVFGKIKPNIVIVSAALTNVEYCETNKEEAYKVNVLGIKNIVKLCKEYNSRIIYLSTEYVFDGNNGPYDEEDKVSPINYYGWTKLEGERIIQEELIQYLILRTTVVYGWDLDSKNFIMQLIKNFNSNIPMKVPMDQISSPTYCPNLSDMIKESCDKQITGVYNMVGNDVMDRYEFAVKSAELLDLDKELLIPVETRELSQIAKRPLNAGLKVDKISKILDNGPMATMEGLEEVKKLYMEFRTRQGRSV